MYEAADYLFVSKLPIGTLQPHTRAKSAFFSKKIPVYLHMCNFCSTFAHFFE